MTEPVVYTVEEAAGVLRIGRTAAYSAVRAGDIPSVKVGRSLRVPRVALERMLGLENGDGRVLTPAAREIRPQSKEGHP